MIIMTARRKNNHDGHFLEKTPVPSCRRPVELIDIIIDRRLVGSSTQITDGEPRHVIDGDGLRCPTVEVKRTALGAVRSAEGSPIESRITICIIYSGYFPKNQNADCSPVDEWYRKCRIDITSAGPYPIASMILPWHSGERLENAENCSNIVILYIIIISPFAR